MLSETARIGAGPIAGGLAASALIAIVLMVVGWWPLALLLVVLERRKREADAALGDSLKHSLGQLPAFVLLGGVTCLLRVVVVVAATLIWLLFDSWLTSSLGARAGDLLAVAWAAFTLALLACIGIVQDLARASAVAREASTFEALKRGLKTARTRTGSALVGWLTPAAWSIALWGAAALVVGFIDVSRAGGWRVFAAFVVHQLAVLGFVALRAVWLAHALKLTTRPADAPVQAVAPIV
jgi:hypothetical protein